MHRTLEDIAEALGVSRRSISRFLSGRGPLSSGTRKKIEGFLKEEPYYPNVLGARLASRRVPVMGIVLPLFENHQDGGYYFVSIMRGIWVAASREGMQVTPFSQSPFRAEDCLRIVKSKLAGGLLFVSPGPGDEALFRRMTQERVPCVVLNGRMPGTECYVSNNRTGARSAVRHLIERGALRIGFLNGRKGWSDAEERLKGYRSALKEAGLRFSPEWTE